MSRCPYPSLVALACSAGLSLPAIAGLADSQHVAPGWRGDANTNHFGWDVLDPAFPQELGQFGGDLLNDDTPDFGSSIPTGASFNQVGTAYGHISSSGNYYSGFSPALGANDVITAPTDAASHAGGFTTVVFQMTETNLNSGPGGTPGSGGNSADATAFDRLDITLNGDAATEQNFARGVNANGVSQWFAQWEIAGDPATVEIAFSNTQAHTALDLWEVDVLWSADGGNLVATPTIVPEPASLGLLLVGGALLTQRRRRSA